MLHSASRRGYEPWSTGSAVFFVGQEALSGRLPVAVRCRLGSQKPVVALLDTAAAWSVIDGSTAELLEGHLEDLESPIRLSTRHGPQDGKLHRLEVELLADPDAGSDLSVDATVLVIPEWPGPVVLGFHGLLEHVRFALDPDDDRPIFHFGPRP
jgi:hypothetical protein